MSKSNQIDKIKTNLKKRNFKAFFFFIGFTLLIWFFVQMSKTYNHEVQLRFQLKEIPKNIVVEDASKTLKAQIEQSGFKILSINLFNSTLDLAYNELDSLDNSLNYNLKTNKQKIANSLKILKDELEIDMDTLRFELYRLSTKKLKVHPNFEVDFNKGYDSIRDFILDPQYIEVSGNDSILKTLETISTKRESLKNVSDTISGEVGLQKIDSLSINYSQETVKYTLPVVKFTEGTFEIPISLENDVLEAKLVIFPKTVKVNFKTSLQNYEKIDESGFKVVAKYEPEENYMLLELVKKPKLVKNVSLENQKVDYLVKK